MPGRCPQARPLLDLHPSALIRATLPAVANHVAFHTQSLRLELRQECTFLSTGRLDRRRTESGDVRGAGCLVDREVDERDRERAECQQAEQDEEPPAPEEVPALGL